jgi:hypothetical protein
MKILKQTLLIGILSLVATFTLNAQNQMFTIHTD